MGKSVILGAGLAGLSASFHRGHANCVLLERSVQPFGHVRSDLRYGFTWDEGPHVSFTRHKYVREMFAANVQGDFQEFVATAGNYYKGHWIEHPAQVSLHQVPEPLRSRCLESFLQSRAAPPVVPANYQQWLDVAFGPVFAREFPGLYTSKYWTRPARDLTTDWVGARVLSPTVEDVKAGARGPLGRNMHYITKVRYPTRGGYQSFAEKIKEGANIRLGKGVCGVDLAERRIHFNGAGSMTFDRLVNTIPLPEFVNLCVGVPPAVTEAVRALECSEMLLINVEAMHVARRPETWLYVYDLDKLSTRINFTERLSPGNAPAGQSGIQVEVYAGRGRPFSLPPGEIIARVKNELQEMGLVDSATISRVHTVGVKWANVIYTHDTKPALEVIWSWLERFGLERESDDTHPLTDWDAVGEVSRQVGRLAFAGRYGQWKYFWTDDCVLRGRFIGQLKPSNT